jgi:hypothetical protein
VLLTHFSDLLVLGVQLRCQVFDLREAVVEVNLHMFLARRDLLDLLFFLSQFLSPLLHTLLSLLRLLLAVTYKFGYSLLVLTL